MTAERYMGAPLGHPNLSLVIVSRAAGPGFALERLRRGEWRRLHSFTMQEAQALSELAAAWLAINSPEVTEPGLSLYSDDTETANDLPF